MGRRALDRWISRVGNLTPSSWATKMALHMALLTSEMAVKGKSLGAGLIGGFLEAK